MKLACIPILGEIVYARMWLGDTVESAYSIAAMFLSRTWVITLMWIYRHASSRCFGRSLPNNGINTVDRPAFLNVSSSVSFGLIVVWLGEQLVGSNKKGHRNTHLLFCRR